MCNKYFSLLFVFLCCSLNAASKDPKNLESRIQGFTIAEHLNISVWADQSLTQNPSFFSFDSQGRLLIAEIYRIHQGVDDVRRFSPELTVADISVKTVEDRLKMYHQFKHELPAAQFGDTADQIKLIEDTDGDGKADTSKVFAGGFNDPLDGLGSGVIERNGKVYYTNIPHLWQLEDTNNDGISDQRVSLQDGFGTRVSFLGHDMHGLAWGPDGRLYWSLGDRGYYFTTKEGKTYSGQNLGAVFRSNPDGSNIELFYTGLRNPQELVFDEFGNLFTADNDGDHGDVERINHLIEGGDSGWHAGHQSIMSFTQRLNLRSSKYTGEAKIPVAWLVNDMSLIRNNKQPAFMLPGIGQIFTGPSGITYNPSNYLGDKWRNNFFVSHYGGSPTGSYINAFKTQPNGASFIVPELTEFARGMNVADIDFGPDGRFYIAEFNFGGWGSNNEGAIYALEENNASPAFIKTKQQYKILLTSDLTKKTLNELSELLAIDHQTIRQRAQFTMAERGLTALPVFEAIAHNTDKDVFSRIHSIWGISQLVLTNAAEKDVLKALIPLLQDKNDQVRIQTARVLGDHATKFAEKALTKALLDEHNQVAMYAAIALGKINATSAVNNIVFKLQQNGDTDLWLRHALTMALKGIDKKHWFDPFKNHRSKDVRLGVLLALRHLADNDIAYFLNDADKALVDETIIAIQEKALLQVREKMAAKLSADMAANSPTSAYIHHRLINANFNEGKVKNAQRLLAYAASKNLPDRLASEALAAIEGWHDVNPIDTITGLPTTANKTRSDIKQVIYDNIANVLANTKDKALVQAMRIAGQVNFVLPEKLLTQITQNTLANINIRQQALALIDSDFNHRVLPIAKAMLEEDSGKVKNVALAMIVKNDKTSANQIIRDYLSSTNLTKQKVALANITSATSSVDDLLIKKLKALNKNLAEPSLIIELVSAVEKRENTTIKSLLEKYNTTLASAELHTQYASTKAGGDADIGKALFYGDGGCMRCHSIQGQGSWVGPDLTSIAQTRDTSYLLNALINPSKDIAPGYGAITLTMKNNETVSGVYFGETAETITVGKDRNHQVIYQKAQVATTVFSPSGMPPMHYMLNKAQIRDLLAFLETLNKNKQPAGEGH